MHQTTPRALHLEYAPQQLALRVVQVSQLSLAKVMALLTLLRWHVLNPKSIVQLSQGFDPSFLSSLDVFA